MRVVLAWPSAARLVFPPALCLPRKGSARKAARSLSSAAARARRSAPGRAAAGDGMRMSAAAPALARGTVPADQFHLGSRQGRTSEAAVARWAWASMAHDQWHDSASRRSYSHSIVAGGLDEMSYTRGLIPRTSFTMRDEITGEQIMRQRHPVGRHAVLGNARRAGRARWHKCARRPSRHAAHRKQHPEGLPDALVQPGRPDLLVDDAIALAEEIAAFLADRPQNAHGQSRPGNGWPPQQVVRRLSSSAQRAHLILEQARARAPPESGSSSRAGRPRCDGT